jgi:hypothetical protein
LLGWSLIFSNLANLGDREKGGEKRGDIKKGKTLFL